MLRSLIAYVLFFFAIVASPFAGLQSAQAENPYKGWLGMAADSLEHQISQQIELPWQSLDSMRQHTIQTFDRVIHQCRMGVGGARGMQLVRVVDLLVELRDSGVAGAVTPKKNWNFPAENFELQRCRVVQGDRQSHQSRKLEKAVAQTSAAVDKNLSPLWGHGGTTGQQLLQIAQLDRLATQAKEAMDRLEEAVYRPAQPLVQAANRVWDRLAAMSTEQDRAETSDSRVQAPEKSALGSTTGSFAVGVLMDYWLEVSNSAQAKLNWLTSKVRHIAEACLKSIEPQFLNLELDPLA